MSDFLRKMTSRKFLLALAGAVSGFAMAFGVEGSELGELIRLVGGLLAAVGAVVAYITGEAKIDAAYAEASAVAEKLAAALEAADHGEGE